MSGETKRRKRQIRNLGTFHYSRPVRAWLDIGKAEVCFRPLHSRKVHRIALSAVYDHITGQIVMPFA